MNGPSHAPRVEEAQRRLARLLDELVEEAVVPGLSAVVTTASGSVFEHVTGCSTRLPVDEAVTPDTLFDCASLTKPLVTASLLLLARERGDLRFEQPVDELVPEMAARSGAPRTPTIAELLLHSAGLPSWEPLYALVPGGGLARRVEWLSEHREEPGQAAVYGDPAYMVLGLAAERLLGSPLPVLARDWLFGDDDELHLGLPSRLHWKAAATELGNACERELAGLRGKAHAGWRHDLIRGETHDHNAFTLGGAAGHAGLFGTARSIAALARSFLHPDERFSSEALSELSRDLVRPEDCSRPSERRTWGFQLARSIHSCAGAALADSAFVHSGFTGTSIAVDPERGAAYVLLTNRIHPRWTPRPFHADRARFHAAAAELVSALRG